MRSYVHCICTATDPTMLGYKAYKQFNMTKEVPLQIKFDSELLAKRREGSEHVIQRKLCFKSWQKQMKQSNLTPTPNVQTKGENDLYCFLGVNANTKGMCQTYRYLRNKTYVIVCTKTFTSIFGEISFELSHFHI